MQHFDLCLNWYWEHDGDFVHMVETACALKNISIYQATPLNLLETTSALHEGKMTIGALFDRGNDDLRFEPIRRFVKQSSIFFINPPEVAFEFEQKDKFHFILKENGIEDANKIFVGQQIIVRANLVTPTASPQPTITPGPSVTPPSPFTPTPPGGVVPTVAPTATK